VSGAGSPIDRPFDCHDLRVAVVAASWHEKVMDGLLASTLNALKLHQVEEPVVVRVPGSFELPVVADALARNGFEVVIALGVIIRGGTPHFEFVSSAATDGLNRVALDHGIPVGFGLLTCDDEEQALDRAGLDGSHEDKGYEATSAALQTAVMLKKIRRREHLG
jgi:6,7-dimethyl-8-ribityllumazine synthase